MAITVNSPEGERSFVSALYNPKVRGVFYQALTLVILVAVGWFLIENTIDNLHALNRSFGFGFLEGRAGFNLGQTLLPFSSDSTNTQALLVGLLNTLLISAVGIVGATIVGFIIGIGRLSKNWLIAKLSQTYVEIFRNIPPLLVIFFWYSGVLVLLPQARDAVHLPFSAYLSNRGLAFQARFSARACGPSALPSSSPSLWYFSWRGGHTSARRRPASNSTRSGYRSAY